MVVVCEAIDMAITYVVLLRIIRHSEVVQRVNSILYVQYCFSRTLLHSSHHYSDLALRRTAPVLFSEKVHRRVAGCSVLVGLAWPALILNRHGITAIADTPESVR